MEIEILPGVTVVVDPEKFTVKNALKASVADDGADLTVQIDMTIVDTIDKNESKVIGAVVLRSK